MPFESIEPHLSSAEIPDSDPGKDIPLPENAGAIPGSRVQNPNIQESIQETDQSSANSVEIEDEFGIERATFATQVIQWLEIRDRNSELEEELRSMSGWKKGFWINVIFSWEGMGYITPEQRDSKLSAIGFAEIPITDPSDTRGSERDQNQL